ncbi:MAG: hypothetical protein F4Y82_04915 [Cenarchaeum sp. SB0665_bin_23]|nr:hypothetical protein [Cenarchaeum sp. SB0667_bin_13]MXY37941.1 hypothetical protein [Cenarchaeum sp. SB0664_bin_35]MXY61435.1 hypothetical protein [Cenarchaeum sp. SB0665_bin_23]MXZ94138.1 hypothetical protein [Cenarchaeum sp. SB0666_bin_15]MYC79281.1 hypothetical protein [Cenarchaeum sp. SB0661_bin_35]MYD59276.1 hypothetical protein [Cenarchaeum sp. SB0678_bin_8]MYG32992.1 hypothetical protein [Cenarchaeum sp. SB0677_bin_16]MYI51280.1 hypothetical protein [Cenarchaeum sp. SB0673_bin_9]M
MHRTLSVAIPDSALTDETTKLAKARKISQMARSIAIFGVRDILIYRDGDNQADRTLLLTILNYMETPQFMRRQIFPKMSELKFAGVLHPLAIPSHTTSSDVKDIKSGDIREGLAVTIRGRRYVDVGVNHLFDVEGASRDGRVTVQFPPNIPIGTAQVISSDDISQYWGYSVRERSSITSLLREWSGRIIIAARSGKTVTKSRIHSSYKDSTLVVFGSPQRDVRDIAGGRLQANNMIQLNFFPHQNTRTVRLEEAILGTLSILNTL